MGDEQAPGGPARTSVDGGRRRPGTGTGDRPIRPPSPVAPDLRPPAPVRGRAARAGPRSPRPGRTPRRRSTIVWAVVAGVILVALVVTLVAIWAGTAPHPAPGEAAGPPGAAGGRPAPARRPRRGV